MSRSRRSINNLSSSIRVNGQAIFTVTSVSFVGVASLTPTLIPRTSTISDTFAEYRFLSLKIRPLVTSSSSYGAFAFTQTHNIGGTPASAIACSELGKSIATHASAPNVLPVLSLNRKELNSGMTKWWRFPTSGVADDLEIQGTFYQYSGGTSDVIPYYVQYEVEFRSPLATSVSRPLPKIEDDTSSVSSHQSFVSVPQSRVLMSMRR